MNSFENLFDYFLFFICQAILSESAPNIELTNGVNPHKPNVLFS